MVSAEFIFSLVLAAGISAVLFAVTFTFSMVEVAQYFAFSSARAMASANLDVEDQADAAKSKYKELLALPAFNVLFGRAESWFTLSKDLDVRTGGEGGTDFKEEYGAGDTIDNPKRSIYTGVRFDFNARLMNMRIAFLGSTSSDGEGSAFTSKINALMLREPTYNECMDLQIRRRYELIGTLKAAGESGRYSTYTQKGLSKYLPLEDNGC